MQTNILEYLPPAIANVKEMIEHAKAEIPELERLWNGVNSAYDDQYLYTMGENGIKRWEKILNISYFASDTLEDRRFRIINRLNAQLPYSFRMLESHLEQMCGKDGYIMSYNPDTWTLLIKIALTSKSQYNEVLKLVNQMIPMNLVLNYDLLYNKHSTIASFTHGQLKAYTHKQLRDEVLS